MAVSELNWEPERPSLLQVLIGSGRGMKITIYLIKGGGGYVLVPACFLPSNACEQLYGPMTSCGDVTIADAVSSEGWQRVTEEIDHHSFALLGTVGARRLLGDDHVCLDSQDPTRLVAAERSLFSSLAR